MSFKVGDKVRLLDIAGSRYYNSKSSVGPIFNVDYGILKADYYDSTFSVDWYLKDGSIKLGYNVFEREMELYAFQDIIENIINNLEKIEEKYE